MRSTSRLFMAAVLFIVAAGVARAQDSAAPPPVAPEAVVAPAPLPAIPIVDPNAPAVEPALTIDHSALAVEPVAVPAVEPPAAVVEKPEVTTTTRRVTKKTVKKPAEKPAIEVSEVAKPAAATASVAAVDTSANPPPPNAAASSEPAKSVVPPPPAAAPVAVETQTEETASGRKMGVGGWLLAGLGVATLFALITLYRRRRSTKKTSIPDFTASQDLKSVLAERQ
jgi:outer membrane biosynthesis protein TonB